MQVMVSLFLLLLTGAIHIQGKQNEQISADEYSVYSAYIDELKSNANIGKKLEQVVVMDHTEIVMKMCLPEQSDGESKLIIRSDYKAAFTDLVAKNGKAIALSKEFQINYKYSLVSADELREIFTDNGKDDGWERFYKKFPNSSGIIGFSRVGFNTDRTKALLFKSTSCGSLCGSGSYLLLEKVDGKWKRLDGIECWIS